MSGTRTLSGAQITVTVAPTVRRTQSDIVGNYPGNNILSSQYTEYGLAVLNGTGNAVLSYDNAPYIAYAGPDALSVNTTGLVTRAAALTNPSTPTVNIPVFVAELRDLPKLVKIAGDSLLGKAGSGYLSWQFGWKPLVSDLRGMLDFARVTDKRLRSLKKLQQSGSITGQISGPSNSGGSNTVKTIDGAQSARVITTTQVTSWASVRWLYKPGSLPRSDSDLVTKARNLAYGLDPSQITQNVWQAIPWTWLINWFTGIGDFIVASNNKVAIVSQSNGCVMIHTQGSCAIRKNSALGNITITQVGGNTNWKSRGVAPITVFNASVPFLSEGQLGILGALFAQRGDKYLGLRR
jgi:hypothetical protein